MLRCWKLFIVPSLLLVLFAARAPRAQAAHPEKDRLQRMAEQLESLETTLKQTFAKVWEELKSASAERADAQLRLQLALGKINALDQVVAEMRRDLDAMKKRPVAAGVETTAERVTLEEIKVRLTVIEKQLTQLPTQGRIALYPPAASEALPPREERPRQDDRLKQLEDSLRQINASLKKGVRALHAQTEVFRRDIRDLKDEQARAERKLQSTLATASLQTQLAEIRAELAATKTAPARVALYPPATTDSGALEEIKRRLGTIEDKVAQAASVSQISYYPAPAVSYRPAVTSYYAPPASVGRVVLVNSYPEGVTVTVNGRSYRVATGASVMLDNQPAGSLWYEVVTPTWGARGRRTTNLAANETLTVTIR